MADFPAASILELSIETENSEKTETSAGLSCADGRGEGCLIVFAYFR